MKAINIIGLLLILLTSIVGNQIAPGRYCAFSDNDTVWAFGQTKDAENDKHGFWVYLAKWENMRNLGYVGNFSDNMLNGWLITFYGDSLQHKNSEIHYENGILNGTTNFYNEKGQCNHVLKYQDDEMIYSHYLIYEDFGYENDFIPRGKTQRSARDSALLDATYSMDKILPFFCEETMPDKQDKIIVFNSWTNSITAINVAICVILLILNVISSRIARGNND